MLFLRANSDEVDQIDGRDRLVILGAKGLPKITVGKGEANRIKARTLWHDGGIVGKRFDGVFRNGDHRWALFGGTCAQWQAGFAPKVNVLSIEILSPLCGKVLLWQREERLVMSRCDKLALAGVIIVSLIGAAFTKSFAYHLYFGQMPTGKLLIAVAGWAIATYGPVIVAMLFWRLASRPSVPWLFHILLLPSFYVLLVVGNRLMLSTLDVPDFDDTLGAPIIPSLIVIIVTLAVYFSALVTKRVLRLRARASGG